jgi:hypothetical protein
VITPIELSAQLIEYCCHRTLFSQQTFVGIGAYRAMEMRSSEKIIGIATRITGCILVSGKPFEVPSDVSHFFYARRT